MNENYVFIVFLLAITITLYHILRKVSHILDMKAMDDSMESLDRIKVVYLEDYSQLDHEYLYPCLYIVTGVNANYHKVYLRLQYGMKIQYVGDFLR